LFIYLNISIFGSVKLINVGVLKCIIEYLYNR